MAHICCRGLLAIGSVCLPIHLQPLFTAMIGGAYGLGAVLGPLIGGGTSLVFPFVVSQH